MSWRKDIKCFFSSSLIRIFPVCYYDKHFVNSNPVNHYFIWKQEEKTLQNYRTFTESAFLLLLHFSLSNNYYGCLFKKIILLCSNLFKFLICLHFIFCWLKTSQITKTMKMLFWIAFIFVMLKKLSSCLLVSSAENFYKQFWPRSDCWVMIQFGGQLWRSNQEHVVQVLYLSTSNHQTVNYYSTIHVQELVYSILTHNKRGKHIWSLQLLPTFCHCNEEFPPIAGLCPIRLHVFVASSNRKNNVK